MGEPAARSTSPPHSPAEVQPFGRLGVHVLHRGRAVRRELDRLGRLLGFDEHRDQPGRGHEPHPVVVLAAGHPQGDGQVRLAGADADDEHDVGGLGDEAAVENRQDMGGLIPYGAVPFDMGGQFAADLGYGMAGPGGRGTGTPYAGMTQSGMGYRAMRYGWRWRVDQRFNVGIEGARQDGLGGLLYGLGNDPSGLGRTGAASHSMQVRDGASF